MRAEHSKFEAFSRQRNTALSKYRRVYQSFNDLVTGLNRAQAFYTEMKETVESLHKNVETFVNNRRSEGGQLLSAIENAKSAGQNGLVDWERERLQQLMDRMSVGSSGGSPGPAPGGGMQQKAPMSASSGSSGGGRLPFGQATSPPIIQQYATANAPPSHYGPGSAATSIPTGYLPRPGQGGVASPPPTQTQHASYNPASWGPVSPPPQQTFFPQNISQGQGQAQRFSQSYTPHQHASQPPPGWQPPPPPPGAPPAGSASGEQQGYGYGYPSGPGGYAANQRPQPGQPQSQQGGGGADPWSGLSGWK